jgi:hypothetical protein
MSPDRASSSLQTRGSKLLKKLGLLAFQGGLDLHLDDRVKARQELFVLRGARAVGVDPGVELLNAFVGQLSDRFRHELPPDRPKTQLVSVAWNVSNMANSGYGRVEVKKGVATPKK